jgi:hypothetical protein
VKPRGKARIHQRCSVPGIHQERERPFAANADVGHDHTPDDPYRHHRRRTGLRRTGFLEHGQLYAGDHRRRHMRLRLAAATPCHERDEGDDCERMSSPHCVRFRSAFIVPPRPTSPGRPELLPVSLPLDAERFITACRHRGYFRREGRGRYELSSLALTAGAGIVGL